MKKIVLLLLAVILLSALPLPVSAADSGMIDVKWNDGVAMISPHNSYYEAGLRETSGYATTDVFTVPKAGTKLTWSDSGSLATHSIATITTWKQENGAWVWDEDGALFVGGAGSAQTAVESKKDASGSVTYTYITSIDNESLRLCIHSKGAEIMPEISYTVTNEEGTWKKNSSIYIRDPDTPDSFITGSPISATTLSSLNWSYGYVGSDKNAKYANQINKSNDTYLYSDVFTVPKAGTTVYFYDTTVKDQGGDDYASKSAYVFSTCKKSGSEWVVDTEGDNISGDKVNYRNTGRHRLFWFTTTEDNQNLRICYRAGLPDYTFSPKPYDVFLSLPIDTVSTTGTLTDASYIDENGAEVSYKLYLPTSYPNENSPVVISIGSDHEILEALAADKTDAVLLAYANESDCEKVIDVIINNYDLNPHLLYLIGSEKIRNYFAEITVAAIGGKEGYASAYAAGEALLANEPDPYYDILEGATMYAMGDSYFFGYGIGKPYTWVNHIGEKYGMNYVNYGISGSTVSSFVTTPNPMVERFSDMASGNADIILIEGGRNDRTHLTPFGENDSRDPKTFLGALNIMIDEALVKYPNAIIVLVTPWHETTKTKEGQTNVTFADAMQGLVDYRKEKRIFCLYAAAPESTGVDMDNALFRAKYCVSANDVSHLNDKGMKLVQPYMEKFLAEALTAYRGVVSEQPTETTAIPETTAAPDTTAAPVTTAAPTTTAVPVTTAAPTTTAAPVTTAAPTTTAAPVTTAAPNTTVAPETTALPDTTAAPVTTASPNTTVAPETTAPPAPVSTETNTGAIIGVAIAAVCVIAICAAVRKKKK